MVVERCGRALPCIDGRGGLKNDELEIDPARLSIGLDCAER
jgi:hypothetical protein